MESKTENDKTQLVEQFNDEFKNVVFPVTVFVSLETIFGFLGNLLVLFVFFFRYRVCNFRTFVLCLALTDLISTFTTMPGEILAQQKWYVYPDRQICKIKSSFNIFTLSTEMLCLLLIAVDRYRKICQPFGWQIKPRMAIILCIVIYIFTALISVPAYVLWGTRQLNKIYRNVSITVTICEKDENYSQTKHPFQYVFSVYILCAFSLTSTFVLYIFIVRKLAIHRAFSKQANKLVSRTSAFIVGHSKFYENPSSTVSTSETKQEESYPEISEFSSRQGSKTPASKMKTILSNEILTMDEEEPRSVSPQAHTPMLQPDLSYIEDMSGRHKITDDARYKNISSNRSSRSDDSGHVTNTDHFSDRIPEMCKAEDVSHRNRTKNNKNRSMQRPKLGTRLNTKTKIMLVLTVMFISTTVCYISLVGKIANDDVLQEISDTSRTVYFFFLRLYFINHVVNPIVYGLLDPQFRKLLKQIFFRRRCRK